MKIRVMDGHGTMQGKQQRRARKQKRRARRGKPVEKKMHTAASTSGNVNPKRHAAIQKQVKKKAAQSLKQQVKEASQPMSQKYVVRTSPAKGFSSAIPTKGNAAGKVVNGFSRVYANNAPGSSALNGCPPELQALQGFSRLTPDLQGDAIAALQGFSRTKDMSAAQLQGLYQLGDTQDLEEWEYLLNIEHPSVLQGFPNFILNGKRKDRKAKRKAKRANKKAARSGKKSSLRKGKAARKRKRSDKRGRKTEAKLRRKEARAAKKEEKILQKEARRKRKMEKIRLRDERKRENQAQKTERKRLKWEAKKGQPSAGEIFADIGSSAADIFSNVVGNGSGFASDDGYTVSDLPFIDDDFGDTIDALRDMPGEDALDYGDEFESEMADSMRRGRGKESESNNTPLIIGGLAIGALLLSQKGKKKKKAA